MIEIDSINKMLRYVGELPVPASIVIDELPEGHEAKEAKQILLEVNREAQEQGWWFNTEEWNYPQVLGYITIPNTVIAIKNPLYLVKGGNLYDIANKTKIFEDDKELISVFDNEFEDVPNSFATLVTYLASKQLHTYLNGDQGVQAELDRLIFQQNIKVEKEHMANKSYNLMKTSRLIDRGSNPSALA